jgi:hypothetical protein
MRGDVLRNALRILGVLLGLAVAAAILEYVASESGEVVVLRTTDASGDFHETRLWVVDHDGSAWLRAGNPAVGWFERLSSRPEVVVVRGDASAAFRAVPTPEARDVVNERMQEKYGWADRYVSFFFSREKKIPVRLLPVTPAH